MQKIVIFLITFYQKYISLDTGLFRKSTPTCVFYPTCSEYTKQAVIRYGSLKGSYLGFKRIIRCHPWQKNHFDPLV